MSAATSATTALPAGAVHVGPWEKSPQDGARFRLCLCGIYPAVPGASNGPTAYVSAMQFDDSDGFVSCTGSASKRAGVATVGICSTPRPRPWGTPYSGPQRACAS